MPIHDWTRVPSGLFHHFHQHWSIEIASALNRGILCDGYYALIEQRVQGPEADVIAVETGRRGKPVSSTAVVEPPKTSIAMRLQSDSARYADKANRITIRHPLGNVVAVIEIVSPGNKDSRNALGSFVRKAVEFVRGGIHLLIVDLFPPSRRDPQGIHKAIWDELADNTFELPPGRQLTLVSYEAVADTVAYLEPVAVGMPLPDMPLFLAAQDHISVPLEATYRTTWEASPQPIRDMVR